MTTTTCPSWQYNSLAQSPCQVWQAMGEECLPSFTVNTIDFSSRDYRPRDDMCQCNVAAYNLMAGCFWCKDPATSAWPSLADWQSSCRNTTFLYGIPYSLDAMITYPHWAALQPNGPTWVANDAFIDAQIASSTFISSDYPTSYPRPYYYSDYRSDLYVIPILLITAVSLLILVGLAWCVVLCIFYHRQRERAKIYNDMASYYRFGPATGSQTVPLMQNQDYNPMSPRLPLQQNSGAVPYRTSMYPIADATLLRATNFAEPSTGPFRIVDSHLPAVDEENIAMPSHRAHDSPVPSPLVPISPLPGATTVPEDVKGKGKATEGGAYAV